MCCAWYVEEGELALRVEQREWKIGAGQWIFLAPFQRRDQRFAPDTILRSIRFQFPDPRYWRGFHPVRVEAADWAQAEAWRERFNRLLKALGKNRTWAEWATRQEQLHAWLRAWLELMEDPSGQRTRQSGEEQVGAMLQTLGKQMTLKVNYAELGKISGWSRSQIDRQFRQILGMTPRQWQERRVWREVEYSLITTDEPLKAMAYRFGFRDPAHFSHWFKARGGATPGQCRQRRSGSLAERR